VFAFSRQRRRGYESAAEHIAPESALALSAGRSPSFPLEPVPPVGLRSTPLTIGGVVPVGPTKMVHSAAASNTHPTPATFRRNLSLRKGGAHYLGLRASRRCLALGSGPRHVCSGYYSGPRYWIEAEFKNHGHFRSVDERHLSLVPD
jgi:hypothetical protein